MDEPSKDPIIRELLERIKFLESEVLTLRARTDDLFQGFTYNAGSTADHILGIKDLLDSVVNKVFPNFSKTKEQMDSIVPPGVAHPEADKRRVEKPD